MGQPETVGSAGVQKGARWGERATVRAALGARMSEPAWRTALDQTAVSHGTTILDLGCGSGEFCSTATERGAKATGIDASEEMLRLARQQAPEAEFHRLQLGRLPWQDNSFGVVTAFTSRTIPTRRSRKPSGSQGLRRRAAGARAGCAQAREAA